MDDFTLQCLAIILSMTSYFSSFANTKQDRGQKISNCHINSTPKEDDDDDDSRVSQVHNIERHEITRIIQTSLLRINLIFDDDGGREESRQANLTIKDHRTESTHAMIRLLPSHIKMIMTVTLDFKVLFLNSLTDHYVCFEVMNV